MKYTELKTSIRNEGAKSVYLLEGDDAYFRLGGEEQIKNAFLQFPELNYTSFEGENLKGQAAFGAFTAALENYPFMSDKRIIKVTEFYPSESDFGSFLKPVLDDFPKTAILIIINSASKKGVDLKRYKAVTYIDCNHADRDTVAKWIYVTFKRSGIAAAVPVCEAIADYCLCDMARVTVEVAKLIAYKCGGELTRGEVDGLVYKDAEYRIYEMTNAVANGNLSAFCTIADDLRRKSYDELAMLNSLFLYFRNLLTIISSSESNAALSKLLKMKEYGVMRSREQARAIGEENLTGLVNYIYARISEVKSGLTTPLNAYNNVQNFIFFGRN